MDEESMGLHDEIGFLTIHQHAARLSRHIGCLTRVRYGVFVPWLFEDLTGHARDGGGTGDGSG